MSELTHPQSPPAAGSRIAGFAWFAAVTGGWIVFYALMLLSEPTLGRLHDGVAGLPLVLDGLVWFVFFPCVLALAIWDSSSAEGLRLALVACCAVGWSLAFYPWRRHVRKRQD